MGKQDPIAAMLARKQITAEQYRSALHYRAADAEALARCQAALGQEGTALLGLVLDRGQNLIEIATQRGFDARASSRDLIYLGRRLRECLDDVGAALAKPTLRQTLRQRGLRFGPKSAPAPATASLRDAMP